MGCGSSTTVEPISIHKDHQHKQSRHSSAASRRSVKSEHNNDAHPNSTTPDENRNFNQHSSSQPKNGPVPGQSVTNNEELAHVGEGSDVGSIAHRVESTVDQQSETFDQEDDVGGGTFDEVEGNHFSHDNLQKETFLTGHYTHQENDGVGNESTSLSREEKHERRAKQIERKRAEYDYKEYEKGLIGDVGELKPLHFPMEQSPDQTVGPQYTVLDIVKHNSEAGLRDWFKYGRKVYSWNKMEPIIQDRTKQCQPPFWASEYSHPVMHARSRGISRDEIPKVLTACYVGEIREMSLMEVLDNMKEDVNNILAPEQTDYDDYCDDGEEQGDGEGLQVYKETLGRWLNEYPNSTLLNVVPEPGVDPNSLPFPLPPNIQADPLVLRKWVEDYKLDTELDGDGYFNTQEFIYTECGKEHDDFALSVASHVDDAIPDLDMAIEGDVAWEQIELELVKNDITTDQQNQTLETRSKRTNLNDEDWQMSRRECLAKELTTRHEWQSEKVGPFVGMCDRLKLAWGDFENLCEADYAIPDRYKKRIEKIGKSECNKDERHGSSRSSKSDSPSAGNPLDISDTAAGEHESDNVDRLSYDNPLDEDEVNAPKENTSNKGETQDNRSDTFDDIDNNDDKADSGLEMDNPIEADTGPASPKGRRGSGDGEESGNNKKHEDFFD